MMGKVHLWEGSVTNGRKAVLEQSSLPYLSSQILASPVYGLYTVFTKTRPWNKIRDRKQEGRTTGGRHEVFLQEGKREGRG